MTTYVSVSMFIMNCFYVICFHFSTHTENKREVCRKNPEIFILKGELQGGRADYIVKKYFHKNWNILFLEISSSEMELLMWVSWCGRNGKVHI